MFSLTPRFSTTAPDPPHEKAAGQITRCKHSVHPNWESVRPVERRPTVKLLCVLRRTIALHLQRVRSMRSAAPDISAATPFRPHNARSPEHLPPCEGGPHQPPPG